MQNHPNQHASGTWFPSRISRAWRVLSPAHGAQRSLWAVADQGVVSGGSFLFNLVLARILPSEEFGVAVLVIGGLYLLQSVHRSMVLYPLSLRVAAAHSSQLAHLAVSSAVISFPLSFILGLLLAGAAIVLYHGALAAVLVLLVVAAQSHDLLRWVFLAQMQHRSAVVGDALRYGGALAILGLVSLQSTPTTGSALACIAGGALIGSVWQSARLSLHRGRAVYAGVLKQDAWRLGRWDLLAGSISSVSSQIMSWSLAAWHGTSVTAQMQAVANLLGATHPVMFGLGNLITPAVAQHSREGGREVRLAALRYAVLGFLALVPYFGFLFLFPGAALRLLYGSSSPYATETAPLQWYVAIYAMVYLQMAAKAALNGLGKSREVSIVSGASLLLQLVIVLPLARTSGLLAACAGSVLGNAVDAVLGIRFFTRATAAGRGNRMHAESEAAAATDSVRLSSQAR
jgi:O-antigen/teichoic acid export membrane protein